MAVDKQEKASGTVAIAHAENSLRRLILEGFYTPGQRVSDSAMSDELGVSRTSVREAFQRLINEGLLTVIPNRGAFVTKLSREEVAKLYEVREALEIHGLRLATTRASVERLLAVQEMLSVTRSSIVEHGGRYPIELDFHDTLLELADNQLLSENVTRVHSRLRIARSKSGFVPARARAAYQEHLDILDAMLRRDVQGAEDAMRLHLINSRQSTEDTENSQDSFKQVLLKR